PSRRLGRRAAIQHRQERGRLDRVLPLGRGPGLSLFGKRPDLDSNQESERVRRHGRQDFAPAQLLIRSEEATVRYDLLQKPDFTLLRIVFDAPGEQMLAESSAMVARDHAIDMKTQ